MCLWLNDLKASATYIDFHQSDEITEKANIALDLWNYYLSNNIDSLKVIGAELLHDANEAQNEYAIAVAYRILGEHEIWNGRHELGKSYVQRAANNFLSDGNFLLYSECLVTIGNSFFLQGDLGDAERSYKYALDAGRESGDQTAWFAAELNLGKVYVAKGDTSKALEVVTHFKNEALRINKFEAVSNAYGFLSDLMTSPDKLALKDEYLRKSILYAKKNGGVNQLSHAMNNLAIQYYYKGEMDSAEVYFKESLKIRLSSLNQRLISESYFNLANFYHDISVKDSAYSYAIRSMITAEEYGLNTDLLDALEFLCHDLKIEMYCERSDSLSNVIKSLQMRNDELLDFMIEKYEEGIRKNSSKSSNQWLSAALILFTLSVLGWVIYRIN